MEVFKKGSLYEALNYLDKEEGTQIQFYARVSKAEFKREHGEKVQEKIAELGIKNFDELGDDDTLHIIDGTTNEELISIVIHRLSYQQSKVYCKENDVAIQFFKTGLMWLRERSRGRKNMKDKEN